MILIYINILTSCVSPFKNVHIIWLKSID